jgi:hypothetical protein
MEVLVTKYFTIIPVKPKYSPLLKHPQKGKVVPVLN